jgi:3-oxoacyl-[acyl-carrier-protein] synthase III
VSQLVRAKISALGTYVPPRILSNADLEKMVETSNDWIFERTGIRERHLVDKGVATSDLAVEAAKKALAERGLQPTDIEAILVATVTPDMFFPSTACLVQHKLGAKGAWGFDLSAACSAFLFALQTGAQYIASGKHKRVMVIGADVMSSIIDYTDRATCVIFGDGAGAVILEAAEDNTVGLIDYIHEVDGSGACSLFMPGGGTLRTTRPWTRRCTTSIRMARRSSSSPCASKPNCAKSSWNAMASKAPTSTHLFPIRPTGASLWPLLTGLDCARRASS